KVAFEIGKETRRFSSTGDELKEELKKESPEFKKLSSYLERYGAATYQNSSMEYFPLGEIAMDAVLNELEKAEKFIFVEFFMVEEGIFFDSVLEVLERKVKEGVEVRFMYDDLGCVALLPRNYTETLKKKGINARTFSHIYPFLSTHYNNRDHRKIIVIDGKTAFTGGINLCDEYINAFEKYGHWKDNFIMIKGEAVKGFTLLYMQTWNSVSYRPGIDYNKYLNTYPVKESGYIIPYGDGPYQKEAVAENVYRDILYNAKA
ncbi:MAG: cardiolipin synthase, partial [Lachnospiraceae bacterium]|nr:cardiolipin synthase [Lachnospiraceae bacterium]